MGEVSMDRLSGNPPMSRSVNDRFWPIGDITGGKDPRSAGGQRCRVDEQAAPGSHSHTRTLRQERRVWRFTDGDQDDVNLQIKTGSRYGNRLAPSLFIGL